MFLVAALLGAGAVILPAIAASETAPTVNAESSAATCGVSYPNCWSPSQVTVQGTGGVVQFSNESGVKHGVVWSSGPATPSCSGVPVGTGQFATSFSGSCTFTQAGTYTFYCSYHGTSMSGSVIVNSNGTTMVTTSTQPTETQTGTSPPPTNTSTGASGYPGPSTSTGAQGSAQAGGVIAAAKVAQSQRGKSVRGTVTISPAGAGAGLEVDLLTGSAALAASGHSAQLRVGRLLRSGLHAGAQPFSVALSARARAALRRHGHLALRVRIVVTPAGGPASAISRRVTVRP